MMRLLITLLLLLLPAARAEALQVVIVPLEAKGVSYDTARAATDTLVQAAQRLNGIKVISARESAEQGLPLEETARGCKHELFCLVQIGEALTADRILVGDLARTSEHDVLKLLVIDVAKTSMIDQLRWAIPAKAGALDEALPTAARRLFAQPDAQVVFAIDPSDAKLLIYGEPADQPINTEVNFWSGVYYVDVSRPGYEPQKLRLLVPRGGPTKHTIDLEQDPLWVGPRKSGARDPGDPRVSSVSSDPPIKPPPPPGPSPFANWIAWSTVGAGGAAIVAGVLIRSGAQNDYNALSSEVRYRDDSHNALEASQTREDARSSFKTGSAVMVAGIAVAGVGLMWMVLDGVFSGGN